MKYNKSKKFNFLFGGLFLMVLLLLFWFWQNSPRLAEAAWWNDSWLYRKAMTINHTKVAGDLTDFPMLVSLTDSSFSDKAQEDGGDFVFTLQDGTVLKHEIESYASSTGALVAWVKMPALSAVAAASLYMYYGNASIENQEMPSEVWDQNFVMVQHLEENGTGSRVDSTSFGNSGTPSGYDGDEATSSGKIAGADDLDGMNDYLVIATSSSFDFINTNRLTFSAWVKSENVLTDQAIINFNTSATRPDAPQLEIGNGGANRVAVVRNSGAVARADVSLSNDTWNYVVYTRSGTGGGTHAFYINGQAVSLETNGTNNFVNYDSAKYIGYNENNSDDFIGSLDEVRVQNTNRSAAWIQTEYNNQNDPASFFAVAAEEVGPGPVGYWSFDEGYGATAYDGSGQGNDGVITGGTWNDGSACIAGKCLSFDGFNVTNVVADAPDNMEEFTACAWFRANSLVNADLDDSMYLFYKSWGLRFDNQGQLRFRVPTTSAYATVYSNSNIKSNEWYYVCGVFGGVGIDIKLYLNGVDNSFNAFSGSGLKGDDSSRSLYIGSLENMWAGNLDGFIDEVKIYPYARTADQIKQDYNAGLAGVKSDSGAAASFGGSSDKWLTDGLVGYWKFDESATTSGAVDASGNGNVGTFYGNASTTGGKFGNGGTFDGSGDFASTSQSLDYDDRLTVAAWVKIDTLDTQYFLNNSYNGWRGFRLRHVSGSNIFNFSIGTSDAYKDVYSTTGSQINTWFYLVGTYDGNEVKLYVNGNLDSSPVVYQGIIGDHDQLYIGSNYEAGGQFTNGQIDEVRVYNRALSPDEVRNLYEWAPGPVAHWKFDEMEGATAFDSVASSSFAGGNNGIFGNGTVDYRPTWDRGKFGSALQFDGVNDNVTVNDINLSGSFPGKGGTGRVYGLTIGSWINMDSYNGDILCKYGGGQNSYCLWVNPSGYLREEVSGAQSATVLPLNEWLNASMSYDGTNVYLYVNGALVETQAFSAGYSSGSRPVHIGNEGDPFGGKIDDVRIYNYARTQKQILEDMSGSEPGVSHSGATRFPVLDLNFDEGQGATAYDSSVHNNDGSLQPGTGGTNTSSSSMWTKNGKAGGAMEFDGYDDYINLSSFNPFTYNDFTISTWYKSAEAVASDDEYIFWHDGNSEDNLINFGPTDDPGYADKLRLNVRQGGNNYYYSQSEIVDQNWHHLIGVRGGGRIKLYIDGKLEANGADNTDGSIVVDDLTGPMIGNKSVASEQVHGMLDEFKIWNYALSEDEIKSVYNQNSSLVVSSESGANSNGTTTTGAATEYCVPGDTARCDAPVLELKMDEMSGTTAYDTSGNGNYASFGTGTAAPAWARGKLGGGLKFDGVNDYVKVSQNVSVNNLGPLTFSAWIYGYSDKLYKLIAKKDDPEMFGDWSLGSMGGGMVEFKKGYDGTDLWVTSLGGLLRLNQWIYVTLVWTGNNSASNDVGVYLNGNEISHNAENNGGLFDGDDSASDVYIGNSAGGDEGFLGIIDDVKLYNYARTPAQIAWDYNKGKPIAHWSFNECQGGTIHDESGNGNHGTLSLGSSGTTATGTCTLSSDSFWYNGRSGKYDASGSFDGTSDLIDFGDTDKFDFGDSIDFTVSAWVKPNSVSGHKRVITNGNYGFNNGFFLKSSDVNGKPETGLGGGPSYITFDAANSLPVNAWSLITAVFDQTSKLGSLYINGIQVPVAKTSTCGTVIGNYFDYSGCSISANHSVPITIGSYYSGVERYSGLIDEVKIWNYALTAEQVKNEYIGGAIRFGE